MELGCGLPVVFHVVAIVLAVRGSPWWCTFSVAGSVAYVFSVTRK